jgi:Tol biopolymer transport system component
LVFPKQSPDGREIFFERYDGARWRLVKMPVNGGEIVQIAPDYVGVYSFSPDGKSVAYNYLDEQKKRWMVAIRNISDNSLQKQFEIDPISLLDWTPDGKNLIYNTSETLRDGGSLWQQPIDGSPPKLILDAKEDRIYWAAWSPDKQKLYLTRGKTISNIVLLTRQTP